MLGNRFPEGNSLRASLHGFLHRSSRKTQRCRANGWTEKLKGFHCNFEATSQLSQDGCRVNVAVLKAKCSDGVRWQDTEAFLQFDTRVAAIDEKRRDAVCAGFTVRSREND